MPQRRRGGALAVPLVALLVGWAILAGVTAWRSVVPAGDAGPGPGNYRWIVDSASSTLVNTVLWVVVVVVGATLVSGVISVVVGRSRLGPLVTALLVLPAGSTLTAVAVAWRLSFAFRPAGADQVGVVNAVLDTVGIGPVAWLTQEPVLNTLVLAAALVWVLAGLGTVLLVPAVRRIPEHLFDAARDEGLSGLQVARRLVVPSIRGQLGLVALLSAVAALRAHDIVRVATDAMFDTGVLGTESFERSIVQAQPGRGAALAVAMAVAIVPAAIVAARSWSRRGLRADPRTVPPHRVRGRRGRHSAPATDREPSSPSRGWGTRAAWLIALLVAVAWLVPVVGVALTAVRPATAGGGWWTMITDPALTLDNLRTVLDDGDRGGMWTAVLHSAAIALPATTLTVALGALSADGLRHLGPRWRTALQAALVVVALMPLQLVLHPLREAYDAVGLDGTLPGIWLAHVAFGLPLATLLLRPAIGAARTPTDVEGPEEPPRAPLTARSRRTAIAPAALAVAAVHFLLVWNDYLLAVTLLGGDDATISPVTVRLAVLTSTWGQTPHLLAAGALVTLVVPVAVLLATRAHVAATLVGASHDVEGARATSTS